MIKIVYLYFHLIWDTQEKFMFLDVMASKNTEVRSSVTSSYFYSRRYKSIWFRTKPFNHLLNVDAAIFFGLLCIYLVEDIREKNQTKQKARDVACFDFHCFLEMELGKK